MRFIRYSYEMNHKTKHRYLIYIMKSRNQQSVSLDSVWKNFEEIRIKITDLNFFFFFLFNLWTTPKKQFYSYTTLQNLIFT